MIQLKIYQKWRDPSMIVLASINLTNQSSRKTNFQQLTSNRKVGLNTLLLINWAKNSELMNKAKTMEEKWRVPLVDTRNIQLP